MNGAKKFHSPDGPAFNEGEVWVGSSKCPVTIYRTERFGDGKWDVNVHYWVPMDSRRSIECIKDAWNFQVRYQHIADKEI